MSRIGRLFYFAATLGLVLGLAVAPTDVHAAKNDCGQPISAGASPTASDCLFMLNAAVGATTCDFVCTCDLNNDGNVTATDALQCLNAAVGVPDLLNCEVPCPPGTGSTSSSTTTSSTTTTSTTSTTMGGGVRCSGGALIALAGSDLDAGWNGAGHNSAIIEGAEVLLGVVKRCSVSDDVCDVDADCPGAETCKLTCNCDSNNAADANCEITGPTGPKRCLVDMNVTCVEDADCPGSQTCESFFGPPLPLSAEGTPTCVTSYFQEPISGFSNAVTGETNARALLRSRVHLGISLPTPCPRCGELSPTLALGDAANCEGGPNNGTACTVEAISPDFGGVSTDCPPDATANVSGQGLIIDFENIGTGTEELTAVLPCGGTLGSFQGFCLDDFSTCTDNNDCLRCVDNPSVVCTGDGDCASGTCGAAPEHAVSCGAFCHCGFCDGDPEQPCTNDGDCSGGDTCDQTPGTTEQLQGNNCTDLMCGLFEDELCCSTDDPDCANPTPKIGTCTEETFRGCGSNSDCAGTGSGTCVFENRPCFENTITRTGAPSPLGSYCIDDPTNSTECTSNADCATGECIEDSSRPLTVALFCTPPTASASINAAGGIPGPGAVSFNSAVVICRCGDGELGCAEECDDGNNVAGDGCDDGCNVEP